MPEQKLTAAQVERIRTAGPEIASERLAEECGVSERQVRRYRRQARLEREDVAREALVFHASSVLPQNLGRLDKLARLCEERLESENPHPTWGRLLLTTIQLQLDRFDRIGPPDPGSQFEDYSDEELEETLLLEIRERILSQGGTPRTLAQFDAAIRERESGL